MRYKVIFAATLFMSAASASVANAGCYSDGRGYVDHGCYEAMVRQRVDHNIAVNKYYGKHPGYGHNAARHYRPQPRSPYYGVHGGYVDYEYGGHFGKHASQAVMALAGASVLNTYIKNVMAPQAAQPREQINWHEPRIQQQPAPHQVSRTIIREGRDSSGHYCREYQTTVTVGGRQEHGFGTACMKPDGQWVIVK